MLALAAIGSCVFGADASAPQSWSGVCLTAHEVPAGCPIAVVVPHDQPRAAIDPLIYRGEQQLAVAPAIAVDSTVTERIKTTEGEYCACTTVYVPVETDRLLLTYSGLTEGDTLWFLGGGNTPGTIVTITATGSCPAPMWLGSFEQPAPESCNMCIGDDLPGHDGGCSASPGAGLLVAAAALLLALRRR